MTTTTDRTRRADVLDDALERLSGYSYVDGPGMATHGPMGAEALASLGYDDLVVDWIEGYKARHDPIDGPPPSERLDPDDQGSWRSALGDPSRLADWQALFTHRLDEEPWPDVVRTWVPRLLPGYGGAFTHGLIRTSHAVRGLELRDRPSAVGRRELATALAYWAGTYLRLPGEPTLRGDLSLPEALARLPRPTQAWTPIEAGMFSRIGELPDFPDAVAALGPPDSVDGALSDLTAAFARSMLAHPDAHPMGLIHAVTPVGGARTLLPYLPDDAAGHVYGWLWHVDAAITAGFVPPSGGDSNDGDGADPTDPAADAEPFAPDELAARAAAHRDPHAVKFTAACLAEHAIRPDPAYLLAAQHAVEKLPAW